MASNDADEMGTGAFDKVHNVRCRRYVDQGLERLGASDEAREFCRMHAVVDPLHGQGWLEHAVIPLAAHDPAWGPRILRGARGKSHVNNRFFDWAERTLVPG